MKYFILLPIFLSAFALSWILTRPPQTSPSKNLPTPEKSTRVLSGSKRQSAPRLVQKIKALPTHEDRVREIIALASSLPIDQIKTWREQSFLDPFDDDLEFLFNTITSQRWLEAAPEDFLNWFGQTGSHRLGFYLGKFADQDPEAALAFVDTLPGGLRDNPYRVEAIFESIVRKNPSRALELINQNLDIIKHGGHYAQSILTTLAKASPREFAVLRKTWPEYLQRISSPSLAAAHFQSDFQSGLDFLTSENLGYDGFTRCFQSANIPLGPNLEKLPPGWLKKIITQSPYLLSYSRDISIFDYDAERLGLNETSFTALLTRVSKSNYPASDRPRILELLNNESLPDAAANNLLANQISSWSPSDRQGLESWIASITSPARREQALKELDQPKAIPFSITPRDPTELIAEHKSPNSAQPGPWSPRQTEEAITAYHQLTPEQKNEIFHQQKESPQDPFRGSQGKPSDSFQAEIYRDRLLNPPPNDKAPLKKIITFASTWASREPAKAATWAATLPPGPSREWALKNIASRWHSFSKTETQAWINSLPNQEGADVTTHLKNLSQR